VIVTDVPTEPIVGVKLVIVGAPVSPTTKETVLVAFPPGALTVIGPVVAPAGTVVVMRVAVAEITVAAVPLKVMEF